MDGSKPLVASALTAFAPDIRGGKAEIVSFQHKGKRQNQQDVGGAGPTPRSDAGMERAWKAWGSRVKKRIEAPDELDLSQGQPPDPKVLARAWKRSMTGAYSKPGGWAWLEWPPGGKHYRTPRSLWLTWASGKTLDDGRELLLCGAVADPGTCGDGGTWNNGTATCSCGVGYEQSDDERSCIHYRAGICARNLGPFPFPIGIVRHDDVQSYRVVGTTHSDERTSGFYAADEAAAVTAAATDLLLGTETFVEGEHKHSFTTAGSDCDLPVVDEARFDNMRSRSDTIVWTRYHLLNRNCQHWADEVVPDP